MTCINAEVTLNSDVNYSLVICYDLKAIVFKTALMSNQRIKSSNNTVNDNLDIIFSKRYSRNIYKIGVPYHKSDKFQKLLIKVVILTVILQLCKKIFVYSFYDIFIMYNKYSS